MDARSLSDFFSHNGYGCPLPLQAATAAAAADGSAVCFFSWGLTCLAAWVKNEFDANAVGRNSPSGPKQPLITNLHTGPKQPLSPTGLGKISATARADLTSRRGGMSHQLIPRRRGQPKRPKQPNVYSFLFRFLAAVASSSPSLDDLARSLSRFCCRKP